MALPVITNWPFKIIDGYKSEWNGASLPIIYDITNTKWPTNTDDSTIAITSITDDNGYAKLNRASNDGEVAKDWVTVAGTTNYDGVQQVRSVDGNNLTIDADFVDDDTGTTLFYYQNYTSLIRVYAGLDPAHAHAATKPIELIGTIEQRPDTNNITLANVRDYVKDKLNTVYDESQASWPNDLNGWTDFYISFAERYDLVVADEVTDFTSEYRDDEADGGINYLKAAHGGLQFGAARGGNMHDYVIKNSPYSDVALWMTDFTRPKIIGDQNFNLSIISGDNLVGAIINIERYDSNGDLLGTDENSVLSNDDYGLYRLPVSFTDSDDLSYIIVDLLMFLNWVKIGNDFNIPGVSVPFIAGLTSSQIAYIDRTNDDLRTYSFDGADWVQVGNDLNIPGITGQPSLAALTSSRIVMWEGNTDSLQTYDFDGTDWSTTGNPFLIAGSSRVRIAAMSSARIAIISEIPSQEITAYDFDGTDWTKTGNTFTATGYGGGNEPDITALTSSRVAIMAADSNRLRAVDFDGTNWAYVGNAFDPQGASIGTPSITGMASSRIAYIDVDNDDLRTYEFDGTDWAQVGNDSNIGAGSHIVITSLTSSRIVYIDGSGDDLRVYDFAGLAATEEITIDIE